MYFVFNHVTKKIVKDGITENEKNNLKLNKKQELCLHTVNSVINGMSFISWLVVLFTAIEMHDAKTLNNLSDNSYLEFALALKKSVLG